MFAFPETVGVKLLVTEEALFKQPAADSSSSLKDATWTDATAPGGGGGGGVSSVPPPVLFSFVLTDEKSRRLYATALRVRPSILFLKLLARSYLALFPSHHIVSYTIGVTFTLSPLTDVRASATLGLG